MLPAYLITNIRFTNPEKAREYGSQVAGTVTQFGGRYLARGGHVEAAEGDWPLNHMVLVEFPSLEQAKRWYDSAEYRPLKALRQENADSHVLFMEGLAPN